MIYRNYSLVSLQDASFYYNLSFTIHLMTHCMKIAVELGKMALRDVGGGGGGRGGGVLNKESRE